MSRTASETTLRAVGWSIAHTNPLTQEFVFERFDAGRRVASAHVRGAKTTAEAWRSLRELLDVDFVLPRPRASA